MVDYSREEKYKEYGLRRKLGFFEKLEPMHVAIIIIAIVIGIVIINKDPKNQTYVYWGVIIILGLYILYLWRKKPLKEPIPEDQIKRITTEKMKNKIGRGLEYPEGTRITQMVFCFLRHWQDVNDIRRPIKWEIGYKIKEPQKPEYEVIVKCDPFNGEITGIVEAPLGYDGNSSKDIVVQEVILPNSNKQQFNPSSGQQ